MYALVWTLPTAKNGQKQPMGIDQSSSVSTSYADESSIIDALQNGDEATFTTLLNKYQASMVRLAMIYVGDRAVAEEVVQETWLGVLRGLSTFERRSSLKTWLFRILANRAKSRAEKESRFVAWDGEFELDEPAVSPERFIPEGSHDAGHWKVRPPSWEAIPEEVFISQELQSLIRQTISVLPPGQQEVIRLRDIEGWTAEEVCEVLGLSPVNQRVLLHRARSKVRSALETYLLP